MIDLNDITITNHCLIVNNAKSNELGWLWHRRLGHASIFLIDVDSIMILMITTH